MIARVRGERGATAVELALLLPVVFAFVAMLLFGGLHALYSNTIDNAASEAARLASIREGQSLSAGYPTAEDIEAEVNSEVLPGFVPDANVTIESPAEVPNEGDRITVTVEVTDLPVLDIAGRFLSAVGIEGFSDISRSASTRRQ